MTGHEYRTYIPVSKAVMDRVLVERVGLEPFAPICSFTVHISPSGDDWRIVVTDAVGPLKEHHSMGLADEVADALSDWMLHNLKDRGVCDDD